MRTANDHVHADNDILRKQLSDYLHLLESLQTKSIRIETATLSKNANNTYCSKLKTISQLTKFGSQVSGTVNRLRREYFYLILSENANAKTLSIPTWDQFSNEVVIDQWRFSLLTPIVDNNFVFTVINWDCAKKSNDLSNKTLKEFTYTINKSYNELQNASLSLVISSGNPIVKDFETLLKSNDMDKIGPTY